MTSRHEPATLISWSLPRQRDVTLYRSPGCADVLRGARADVTDFSYMTLMDKSVVKHNMPKRHKSRTVAKADASSKLRIRKFSTVGGFQPSSDRIYYGEQGKNSQLLGGLEQEV